MAHRLNSSVNYGNIHRGGPAQAIMTDVHRLVVTGTAGEFPTMTVTYYIMAKTFPVVSAVF